MQQIFSAHTTFQLPAITANARYKVYPNPTHDMLIVEAAGDEIHATIYDVAGCALTLPYMQMHGKLQINTASLASVVRILRCAPETIPAQVLQIDRNLPAI